MSKQASVTTNYVAQRASELVPDLGIATDIPSIFVDYDHPAKCTIRFDPYPLLTGDNPSLSTGSHLIPAGDIATNDIGGGTDISTVGLHDVILEDAFGKGSCPVCNHRVHLSKNCRSPGKECRNAYDRFHTVPFALPQNQSCHEKARATRSYLIIRDGT